jgi:hypothetical protein
METQDSGKKVCLLLAVGAVVVTLVGIFAGIGDKYVAVPSDSRTSPVRTPPERWYIRKEVARFDLGALFPFQRPVTEHFNDNLAEVFRSSATPYSN